MMPPAFQFASRPGIGMLPANKRSRTSPSGDTVHDAACCFNPLYGRGMSVAALEACLLKRLLETSGEPGDLIAKLAPTFFKEMQSLIETPWSVAMLDFVFPQTRGKRPADFEMTLKFGSR
jgi:hypothetical protein